MKVVSLFTGAGGLDLGLQQAGHEIILQCEINPGAQQVLKKHFPGHLLVPDICQIARLPESTELVAAGFPCIDISHAGLRRGLSGRSSGLVDHVIRLLQDAASRKRPVPWVLLENVEALLDRIQGQDPPIKQLVEAFERLGYSSWAHRVICSAAFSLPNRRRRVFLLASWHGDARDVLLAQGRQPCMGACQAAAGSTSDAGTDSDDEEEEGRKTKRGLCYLCHDPEPGKASENCSFALDLGNARSAPVVDMVPTFTTQNERICLLLGSSRIGSLRIQDAERLQGLDEGWTESCYPIEAPGAVGSARQRQLRDSDAEARERERFTLIGNAVTVPVARWIGQQLMQLHHRKFQQSSQDVALPPEFASRHRAAAPPSDDAAEPEPHAKLQRAGGSSESEDGEDGEEEQLRTLSRSGSAVVRQVASQALLSNDGLHCGSGAATAAAVSWPRAAWWVRGMQRFEARNMSEAPVVMPLVPLGEFIKKVGQPPGREAVATYLQRLREHGWNIRTTVDKLEACGHEVEEGVAHVTDIHGLPEKPESVGKLVWVHIQHGQSMLWWPAEVLDPYQLPFGRRLPAKALESLPHSQQIQLKRLLRQRPRRRPAAPPATPAAARAPQLSPTPPGTPPVRGPGSSDSASGSCAAAAAASSSPSSEGASGDAVAATPPPAPASADPQVFDKVLLVLFGKRLRWDWRPVAALDTMLDYAQHKEEKEQELRAAVRQSRVAHLPVLLTALQEARIYAGVQSGDTRGDDLIRDLAELGSLWSQAARKLPSCGRCEACIHSTSNATVQDGIGNSSARRRKCLAVRAAAAAASGHTGAQLAVHGKDAVGARVELWWPLDEAWYRGQVADYDRIRLRHTVRYDDGDVETVPLWAPSQLVRVLTPPESWQADAAEMLRRQEHERERVAQERQEKDAQQAKEAADRLSKAERVRKANVERNRMRLRSLLAKASVQQPQQAGEASTDDDQPIVQVARRRTSAAPAPAPQPPADGAGAAPAGPAEDASEPLPPERAEAEVGQDRTSSEAAAAAQDGGGGGGRAQQGWGLMQPMCRMLGRKRAGAAEEGSTPRKRARG